MRTLLLIFLFLSSLSARAQYGWELGGQLGMGQYFGDLNTDYSLRSPGPAAAVLARYNLSNRWAVRLAGGYTRVRAADANSANVYERARNLSFRSDVIDGALGAEFNFLTYNHGSRDRFYTPYVFGGLLVSRFNPQAELDGTWVDLRDYGTEGQFAGEEYYNTSLGLNYGLGFKVDLSFEWSLNFEFSARQLFSDYLDDVSTVYPGAELLDQNGRGADAILLSDPSLIIPGITEEKIGEPGRTRGNPNDNDAYATVGVSLMYYFGDLRCPTIGSGR